MDAEAWAEIRRLRGLEKCSVREIARRMRLSRNTVRAALRSEGVPVRQGCPRASKLESFHAYIRERLEAFPRITSVRLLRELGPMGYAGGVTQLKRFVATVRVKAPEAFFRLETLPGEQAQVDWANCGTIRIGNAARKLSAFVMVLSYSRMMYVELTLSQCLEDFLQAHLSAFRFFGGVPRKILYDNLKSVCLSRLGAEIRFNPKFLEFSGHYLFEPVLCRPGHGNEKGKVERGIRYLRSSFLDGRPREDLSRLREELRHWLDGVANVRAHAATRRRPVDRFEEEKPRLQPVPELALDLAITRPVKATSQGHVHFDGNLYSVPFHFASKMLTLKATQHEVRIIDGTRPIAKHGRSYDRGRVIENPDHYAGLLEAKKAAQAAKVSDRFLALAERSEPCREMLERYLKGLVQSEVRVHRHLVRILALVEVYGRTEIFQAVERALQLATFGAHYLHQIILQQRARRGEPEPAELNIPAKPEWAEVGLPQRDLATYDDLFEDPDAKKTDDRP